MFVPPYRSPTRGAASSGAAASGLPNKSVGCGGGPFGNASRISIWVWPGVTNADSLAFSASAASCVVCLRCPSIAAMSWSFSKSATRAARALTSGVCSSERNCASSLAKSAYSAGVVGAAGGAAEGVSATGGGAVGSGAGVPAMWWAAPAVKAPVAASRAVAPSTPCIAGVSMPARVCATFCAYCSWPP